MAPAGLAGTQLVNGGFESGPGIGWEEYSLLGLPVIVDTRDLFDPGADIQVTPHTGDWAAWLGGQDNEISYIRQQVTVGSATPVLGYWHWIQSTDTCGFDLARILVDGVQVRSYSLCRNSNTGGWVKQSVDLSAYLGQTIILTLQASTDGSYVSSLYVDDAALEPATPATVTPTPTATATATRTRTQTATATPTLTPSPTATPTATSSATATPMQPPTPTATETATLTPTATASATLTATATATRTATQTPTASPAATATPTASSTPSATPTATGTATLTPTADGDDATLTPTQTETSADSPTATHTYADRHARRRLQLA